MPEADTVIIHYLSCILYNILMDIKNSHCAVSKFSFLLFTFRIEKEDNFFRLHFVSVYNIIRFQNPSICIICLPHVYFDLSVVHLLSLHAC